MTLDRLGVGKGAVRLLGHSSVWRGSVVESRFGGNDLHTLQGGSELANKEEYVKGLTASK